MASTKLSVFLPLLVTLLLAALLSSLAAAESQTSFATKKLFTMKKEKLTHLHFYWSNFQRAPTAVSVAPILNNATFYGAVTINDDTLTLGPDPDNSTSVGKARGLYHFPSNTTSFVYEMIYSFAFTYGDYNGSSLSLLGSVFPSLSGTASELTVAGGTGVFRFARGYAVLKFASGDPKRSLLVNELDVYVSHY
ncbi:unnamed protein product [Linum tenue]|uniref:Dirigent protein n=1 Tax=Linum tenue TaxID=586396 RepID=A0AAV0II02_9ROSI|nr:unnamed protein product [Linum tenue]